MKKQGKIALFALSVAFIFGLTCLLLSMYLPKASKSNGIMLGQSNNPKITMSSIVLEDDVFNSFSGTAVAGVEVTAEITPADAYVSSVAWSVAWVDETVSETISDYITLHEDEENELVVNVIVEQAFGKQAQLKIVVVDCFGTEKSATCALDYIARVTGLTGYIATDDGDVALDGADLGAYASDGATYVDYWGRSNAIDWNNGTGSVKEEFIYDKSDLSINPDQLDKINDILGTDCAGRYEYILSEEVGMAFKSFFNNVCDYANRSDEEKVAFSNADFSDAPLIIFANYGHGSITGESYVFYTYIYVDNDHYSFLEGVATIESVTLGDDIVI